MKHTLELTPRDLLFLRDARPMEASDAGLGANWPRPDQLYHALLAAFHLRWPERQTWEGDEHTRRDERADINFRFGALKIVGPFPKKKDEKDKVEIFFPRPLDLGMKLVECRGTDLPSPLKYAFLPTVKGKASLPQWISSETYERYLARETVFDLKEKDSDLYGADRNIGIGIDPDTGTTVEHQLYQAEYLRLKDNVTLVCEASCEMKLKQETLVVDAYDYRQTGGERLEQVVLGGQQGMCSLSISDGGLAFPARPEEQTPTQFVRWTLLTPAVFNAGWKPGWLDADGRVMLPRGDLAVEARRPGESRKEWRERLHRERMHKDANRFDAYLVAARIEKPIAFSGWDMTFGPKPTLLAVPAGSCYVFKCGNSDEAKALANVLDHAPRSDRLGSNGFGIGVCSFMQDPEVYISTLQPRN